MKIENGQSTISLRYDEHIDFFGYNTTSDARVSLLPEWHNGLLIHKRNGQNTYGLKIQTANDVLNAISVEQSNNEVFVIKNNGRVGIGTPTPDATYMLDVKGKIRGCEVRVNNANGWCDYVFAENYELMPLAKLEAYIKEHHRLPEMPSAEEVEKEGGFDLAKTSVALLKRSEENTLYIIELENELIQTKSALDANNQRVLELENRIAQLQTLVEKLISDKK
jgi:hypothetical protein